ncbi:OmpA family protein [Crocinitomicaceae bacterium]|nr:OmpA family protein [Crocinitomicaceae bacterium]
MKKYTSILFVLLLLSCSGEQKPQNDIIDDENQKVEEKQDVEEVNKLPKANWSNPAMNAYGANVGEYIKALFVTNQFDKLIEFIYYPECYDVSKIKYLLLNSDFGYDIDFTNLIWKPDSTFEISYKAFKNNTSSLDIYHGLIVNDTAKLFFYPNNSNPFKSNGRDDFDELCELLEDLDNVFFEFNSAKIKKSSYPALKRILDYFSGIDQYAKIIGHTSSEGSNATNRKLSLDRANAIKNYLVKNGIDTNKLETEGKGSREPIYPNDTEENRQKNRRVEVVFSIE